MIDDDRSVLTLELVVMRVDPHLPLDQSFARQGRHDDVVHDGVGRSSLLEINFFTFRNLF